MAKEIERKFLVRDNSFTLLTSEKWHIRQAYLSVKPESTVRVRVCDEQGWITIKGKNTGAVRDEWEYPVPATDAEEMACNLAGGWAIDKTRHIVMYQGFRWEVDVFHGSHEGLIVAEIELPDAIVEPPLPPFIGKEVTGDPAYYNSVLSRCH